MTKDQWTMTNDQWAIYRYLYRLRVFPAKLSAMEAALNSGQAAKFYFDHFVLRHWHVERGRSEYRLENLNKCNYLPRFAYLGLMDSDEFGGDTTKNNFIFNHFNLSELRLVSGERQFPSDAFTPEYRAAENPHYEREFLSMFAASGRLFDWFWS